MGLDSPIFLLLPLLSFVIGAFILRFVLSVPTKIKILKAQTELLTEIAKKQGVEAETIDEILNEMNA